MKKTSCLGIYLATLFSCASGWTETNPPDVVKLDLIPGKIVEEDRMPTWIVVSFSSERRAASSSSRPQVVKIILRSSSRFFDLKTRAPRKRGRSRADSCKLREHAGI